MAATGAESTVRLPGIVLSSLMFEHLNTDSDVVTLTATLLIFNISASFYTNTGEVDLDALKKHLGDCKPVRQDESVIGWYKQRRNTDQQMTLREKTIHKNLKNTLSNPHMIFLLLTPSYFPLSGSTHKTEYAAYILRCRQVINVPVLVNNLGLLEPGSYSKVPSVHATTASVLLYSRSKFFSSNGLLNEVEEINSMNDSLQSELYVSLKSHYLQDIQIPYAVCTKIDQNAYVCSLFLSEPNDPPEPKKNVLLHSAVQALFACSPLFQSQTLTTSGFPILDFCCSLQNDEETLGDQSDRPSEENMVSEVLQRKLVSRKRPTELSLQDNDHKHKRPKY
uniref:MPN domain-containing protein n=1 Tax=Periophthalmus magnuspinnatus TaxID=409849 RepID=A0A3B3ZG11_9GOBI